MLKIRSVAFILTAAFLMSSSVSATDRHATKDDAQAMATKAAELVKKDGEKALDAFNKGGEWRDGDLYVFVIDKAGTSRAHAAQPERVGTNLLNKPDANGKLYAKEIVAIDKNGWVDYKFKSPADDQEHDKSSYCVRAGDYLVCAGAYKY